MLDFSRFKKVAEDKDSITMRHKDGHEIHLAMKALPKIQQEQLKSLKLADGGEIKERRETKANQTGTLENYSDKGKKTPIGKMNRETNLEEFKKSKGPNIRGLADGGDPADAPAAVDVNNSPSDNPYANKEGMQTESDRTLSQMSNPSGEMATVDTEPANIPIPHEEKNIDENGQPILANVQKNQQNAEDLKKNVAIESGKQHENIESGVNQSLAMLAQRDQNNLADIRKHTDDFAKYAAANPIDPRHYQNSQDRNVGQKVAGAIGLFLGGFKSGLVGGSNPAMDYLNAQIDRDISAQKERFGQQKTVWGAYHDLYGDSVAANNAAKASTMEIYKHTILKAAAQLGTPTAIANAMKAKAAISIEQEKLMKDAAADLSAMPGGGPHSAAVEQQPNQPTPQGNGASGDFGEETTENHILVPGADKKFSGLTSKFYTNVPQDELSGLHSQYNQAVQAEKGLNQINDTFNKLAGHAAKSGEAGNIRRNFSTALEALPMGLGRAAAAPVKFVTDTEANRMYDADKTALLGYISSALKGTNIGGGQIQEIVDVNSPEYGDSKEVIAKKQKNIMEFIQNHTDTSLLKKWGLSKH